MRLSVEPLTPATHFGIHHPKLPSSLEDKNLNGKVRFDFGDEDEKAAKWLDAQPDDSFEPKFLQYETFLRSLQIEAPAKGRSDRKWRPIVQERRSSHSSRLERSRGQSRRQRFTTYCGNMTFEVQHIVAGSFMHHAFQRLIDWPVQIWSRPPWYVASDSRHLRRPLI